MITTAPSQTRDYLSYSSIRMFQGCPLRYRFRYIDGLPEECVASSLAFGSAIHSVIEFFYQQQLAGEELPNLDTLLGVYQKSWRDRPEGQIQFGKTETADSLHGLADQMLTAFLNSELTQPSGKIIGIEEELRGELSPGLPDLLGRIDLLLETDDSVIVQDFKTSRSAWSDQQAADQSEQLLLYADVARRIVPGKQLRLQSSL